MPTHPEARDSWHVQHSAKGQRYQIRVRGALGETLLTAFPDLQAESRPGETVLTGTLADQSALYGVLLQIEALGLELLEVHREDACEQSDGVVA